MILLYANDGTTVRIPHRYRYALDLCTQDTFIVGDGVIHSQGARRRTKLLGRVGDRWVTGFSVDSFTDVKLPDHGPDMP